jgi:hypothetical protein
MMATPSERVPDWLLERLAAGELPVAQARALRERLSAAGEQDRLDALAASNREILTAHPADQVTAEVRRRAALVPMSVARRMPAIWRPVWALSFATAGAAAIALLLVRAPQGPSKSSLALGEQDQETITIKGLQPSLGLYRKTAAGVERLGPKARVRPGDIVQVRYIAAGKRYGVVASCDARGAVTLHLPETPGQAVALAKDGERALAHAYELDNSPGFERFVFVTADAPFATDLVVRSLKQGAALPRTFASWSITLEKETP